MESLSDVMKVAPRYLTRRYGALNSYVWESLFPSKEKRKILNKIEGETERKREFQKMKELVDEATLLIFIFVTKKIFIEGSNAAKQAVDTLKELGIKEFYLGKSKFSGRNENVVKGEMLAKKLFNSLDQTMQLLVTEAVYISDIINKYKGVDL